MPAHKIKHFDLWQPGFGGVQLEVYIAGTTTLAALFTDEALTAAAANPQTLLNNTVAGINYGRLSVPLYTASAYELSINGERTGVIRPSLSSLASQDASDSTVVLEGQTVVHDLDDVLFRTINAADYGAGLSTTNTSQNTDTLLSAINEAASRGGATVFIPAGTWPFSTATLPGGVILRGEGKGATILQSQTGAAVITISGDGAGLQDLTLDGVNLVGSSIGLYAEGHDELSFVNAEVKRFNCGLELHGGKRCLMANFDVSGCVTGAKLLGDTGPGAQGTEFEGNNWIGGVAELNTGVAVEIGYEDLKAWHNAFENVTFRDNTATALKINGARFTRLTKCLWQGNTTNIAVQDDDDTGDAARQLNTVIGLTLDGGKIDGGAFTLTGTCADVVLERMELSDVDFTLTTPSNAILVRDSTEDADVTIAGDGTKYTRWRTTFQGASSGLTSDATVTKAWSRALVPGELVYLEGKVLGRSRNSTARAEYHISTSGHRPGSTLAYDTQTSNFTLGAILTGATSGAKGRIIADSDSGTTGTLTLQDISGTFVDNEVITDSATGSALVNGSQVNQNCALLGSVTAIRAAREDVAGWDATFAANGPEIELRVTGAAATTVEWYVNVETVSTE